MILFKKKKRYVNDCATVLVNDFVSIVHDATKICWDKPPEKTYEGKLNYIKKRISTGHESIIEHSNIVMLLGITDKYVDDLLELTENMHYLNYKIKYNEKKKLRYILIGGSIRGYKHLIANTMNIHNKVLTLIKNELYQHCTREFFIDFIEAGLMDNNFATIAWPVEEDDDVSLEQQNEEESAIHSGFCHPIEVSSDNVEIVNIDSIEKLFKLVSRYGFNYNDMLDMLTVTVLFKDISRAAATQIGRHRNAETWESQRYVDYSNAKFVDPAKYVEAYKDKEFYIKLTNGTTFASNSKELGNVIISMYPQLIQHGFNREDARGYLPMNVAIGKLYMTFTYRSLINFLSLRTHPSAQAEVRSYATAIEEAFINYTGEVLEDIYSFLTPTALTQYEEQNFEEVDEIIGPIEESVINNDPDEFEVMAISPDLLEALQPDDDDNTDTDY